MQVNIFKAWLVMTINQVNMTNFANFVSISRNYAANVLIAHSFYMCYDKALAAAISLSPILTPSFFTSSFSHYCIRSF